MKKFKYMMFAALTVATFTGCEDDTDLPSYTPLVLAEDFVGGTDNTTLAVDGWLNYASEGTAVWKYQEYQDDGYAEFTSFNSGDAVNVAWLISKKVEIAEGTNAFVQFRTSQSFLTDPANNKLEVFVSNDFDGTNVEAATWNELTPLALPTPAMEFYEYVNSGEMSMAGYTGNVYVAIRVTGSGTNTSLDGSYQVDNFRIYTK